MRKEAAKSGGWDNNQDRERTKELKEIIAKYGWPTISMVGKKASRGAWLVAQHADHDVTFQKRVLSMLELIYRESRDVDPANIAFLKDRVLVAGGKKQVFGTQFYVNKKGVFGPRPIKDSANMQGLRKKYRLPPFREYLAAVKSYKPILRGRKRKIFQAKSDRYL